MELGSTPSLHMRRTNYISSIFAGVMCHVFYVKIQINLQLF